MALSAHIHFVKNGLCLQRVAARPAAPQPPDPPGVAQVQMVANVEASSYRRRRGDHHDPGGRRSADLFSDHGYEPRWADQRLQYLTRYLFSSIGIIYFNFVFEYTSPWLSQQFVTVSLLIYMIWVTFWFVRARRQQFSPRRVRITMWGDVVAVSVTVLTDPFVAPISSLVYMLIVLGNGMRYGMRYFTEALLATFAAALVVLTLRYSADIDLMQPGVLFLNLFAALVLVYAYVLMSRVDASRRMLERSSRLDALTGLINRRALFAAAEKLLAARNGQLPRLVVMFADLDKFKQINDTRGHGEGDRVLCEVARILRSSVRDADVVARYGGDEFVLLLVDSDLMQAQAIADRIQARIRRWAEANELPLSASLGLGEAPNDGCDLETLLRRVDKALYRSKAGDAHGGMEPAVFS